MIHLHMCVKTTYSVNIQSLFLEFFSAAAVDVEMLLLVTKSSVSLY